MRFHSVTYTVPSGTCYCIYTWNTKWKEIYFFKVQVAWLPSYPMSFESFGSYSVYRETTGAAQRIIYLGLFPDTGHFWVTLKICVCSKGPGHIVVFLSSLALRRDLPALGPLLKQWPRTGPYSWTKSPNGVIKNIACIPLHSTHCFLFD